MKTPDNDRQVQFKLALTRQEAAEAIGQSAVTIDRLTKRGLLRPSRATRRPVYPIREIERFLRDTSASLVELYPVRRAPRAGHARGAMVAAPALSSPSESQEGGNEPSCRASSAEFETVRPTPPREAGGLSLVNSLDVGSLCGTGTEDGGAS